MKMLKYFCFLLILMFVACKHEPKNNNDNNNNDFKYKNLTSKIKENESTIKDLNCDFNTVKNYLSNLSLQSISSIPIAEKAVTKCISNLDSTKKDELYVVFNTLIEKVTENISDSLEIKYDSIINKLYENIDDAEIKEFKKCLDLCNLQLTASEGIFYIEPKYDYCYNLFKNKVSKGLEEYLRILSVDKNEQFNEDAELLVNFDEVYRRLTIWEDFITKYPRFILKKDANSNLNFYFSIFLTGEENTPVFDYETQILLPEVKALYEKIIAKNENRRTTKIISEYFNFLKAAKFKQPDNINDFLKKKGIETD